MWTQLPRSKKGTPTPIQFLAHVYCGHISWWMKTPLGTEVDLSPGHIVLDGVPAPAKGSQQPPSFRPMSIVATVAHLSYCWAFVMFYSVIWFRHWERWRKDRNTPSHWSLVLDEERLRPQCHWCLEFFQCHDAVGCATKRAFDVQKSPWHLSPVFIWQWMTALK